MSLFNKENLEKAKTEAEKRSSQKSKLEPDVYEMTLTEYSLKATKEGGYPMLYMEFQDKAEEYYPLKNYISFTPKNSEISTTQVVEFFIRAFSFDIQPVENCETTMDEIKAVYEQTKHFEKKDLKIAVKSVEELYQFTGDDKLPKMKIVTKPMIWYVGNISEELTINLDKAVIKLSAEDKTKFLAFQAKHGEGNVESAKKVRKQGSDINLDNSDLDDVPDWMKNNQPPDEEF